MRRSLKTLFLCLAILSGIVGNASGAATTFDAKNRVGVLGANPDINTYTLGSLELEPQRGDTIIGYDSATGFVFYVNQNPWSKFDPLGLAEGLLMGGMDGNDVYGYSTAKSHAELAAITEGAQQGAKHGAIAGAVVAGGVAAATYVAEVGITAALTALAKEGASEVVDQAVEKTTGVPMATSITDLAKDGLQKLAKEGAETGLETAKEVSQKIASKTGGNRTQGTRYVGEGEAAVIDSTGRVPNTNAAGDPKTVFYTHDKPLNSAAEAQEAYKLPSKPTHRVTVDTRSAKPGSAGNVEGGTGIELMTDRSLPAKKIQPLDD